MKPNAAVKLIKRRDRVARRRTVFQLTVAGNKWSKSVRSWVVEFQTRDRGEPLPAFDSLFTDTEIQASRRGRSGQL